MWLKRSGVIELQPRSHTSVRLLLRAGIGLRGGLSRVADLLRVICGMTIEALKGPRAFHGNGLVFGAKRDGGGDFDQEYTFHVAIKNCIDLIY